MTLFLLIASLCTFFFALFYWAFKTLPNERWQFLATIPVQKILAEDGTPTGYWKGLNLTYYGFFCATATTVGLGIFLFLLLSMNVPYGILLLMAGLLLFVGLAAARGIARIVEKKKHTFTVSGAAFAGFFLTPLIILSLNKISGEALLPIIPTMAALMVAYPLAESIGRLACISFGCCYGKKLADMPAWSQTLLKPFATSFKGATKKISYESGWENVAVVPIQAITSLIFALTGLIGLVLFINGLYMIAFVFTTVFAIGWRFLSEMLRADFRGNGRISKYQWFSLIMIAASLLCSWFLQPEPAAHPDIIQGLAGLWHPTILLVIQVIWLVTFLYMGRSTVTGSALSFHIQKDHV